MSRIIFDGGITDHLETASDDVIITFHNFLSAARTLKYSGIRMFSWKFAYNTKLIYV